MCTNVRCARDCTIQVRNGSPHKCWCVCVFHVIIFPFNFIIAWTVQPNVCRCHMHLSPIRWQCHTFESVAAKQKKPQHKQLNVLCDTPFETLTTNIWHTFRLVCNRRANFLSFALFHSFGGPLDLIVFFRLIIFPDDDDDSHSANSNGWRLNYIIFAPYSTEVLHGKFSCVRVYKKRGKANIIEPSKSNVYINCWWWWCCWCQASILVCRRCSNNFKFNWNALLFPLC